MMYQNKLVACLKVNGHILRERSGFVLLPFGSEYSILLKNLNSVRVKAKIDVDGQNATSGTWLVIPPNSQMELERFIKDGNWASGNRFKFIERTAAIEAHRGVKADDGIVRIEYSTERRAVQVPFMQYYPVPTPYYPQWPATNFCSSGGTPTATVSEQGITVAGSVSHQTFHAVDDFPTEQSDVMVLELRGIVGNKTVTQAVTVKHKRTCSTCGKTAKAGEFCGSCGTALEVV